MARLRHPRVWNQKVLDEATKVALVLMPNVGLEPRSALVHQIGWGRAIRLKATDLNSPRIAANVSLEPIATNTLFRSSAVDIWLDSFS